MWMYTDSGRRQRKKDFPDVDPDREPFDNWQQAVPRTQGQWC